MKTIFMIEDNEDHALLIRKSIEDENCTVVHYPDGLQVLKACQTIERDSKPDLIFLDLKLPGMDGFEVLQNLKNIKGFNQIPVVMLTTSCRRQEVEKAYQMGASGYIVKSEDFGTLVEKLRQAKEYWFHTVELPNQHAVVRGNI